MVHKITFYMELKRNRKNQGLRRKAYKWRCRKMSGFRKSFDVTSRQSASQRLRFHCSRWNSACCPKSDHFSPHMISGGRLRSHLSDVSSLQVWEIGWQYFHIDITKQDKAGDQRQPVWLHQRQILPDQPSDLWCGDYISGNEMILLTGGSSHISWSDTHLEVTFLISQLLSWKYLPIYRRLTSYIFFFHFSLSRHIDIRES